MAALPVVLSGSVQAGTANGAGSARIVTVITVTATQNLNFGEVYPGIPKSMGYNRDDSAGIFTITGEASAEINLDLVLPEYLSLPGGTDRMQVIFDDDCATVDTTTTTPSLVGSSDGWVNQNPRSLPAGAVIGSGGTTRLYLGGTVAPSPAQTAGSYTGDIILNVSYTGN
jgi:hypothetical protein